MRYITLFIYTLCTLYLFSCQNETPSEQLSQFPEIPKLLDRQKDLRQDLEWDQVQSVYGKNRAKIFKD